MKKIILLLLFFINLIALTLQDGIKFYQQKQYQKAYQIFYQLLEQNNYQGIQLNFYYALSAEKLRKYKEALGAIERILIYEPNNTRVLLERARIYFLMKNYKLAKYDFLTIKNKVDKKTQQEISKYLKAIKILQKTSKVVGVVNFSLGYDSNIHNASNIEKYNIYINDTETTIKNTTPKQESITFSESGFLQYSKKLEKGVLNNSILVFAKQYENNHSKDIEYFRYSPEYLFTKNKHLFSTKLKYGYLIYDNNHYLSIYGIEENIKYPHKWFFNHLQLKIDNKIYEDSKRNSTLYGISDTMTKKYFKNTYSLLLGFEKNKRHKGDLSTINYHNYKVALLDNYLLNTKYIDILNPQIKYEYTRYLDEYEVFKKHQKDNKLTLSLQTIKKLKYFNIKSELKYINNNSNIAPFDYNKWIINISIQKMIGD